MSIDDWLLSIPCDAFIAGWLPSHVFIADLIIVVTMHHIFTTNVVVKSSRRPLLLCKFPLFTNLVTSRTLPSLSYPPCRLHDSTVSKGRQVRYADHSQTADCC